MIELWGATVNGRTCSAIGHFTVMWAQFEQYYFNYDYNTSISRDIKIRDNSAISNEILKNIKNSLVNYGHKAYKEGFEWLDKLCVRPNESHYNDIIKDFLDGNMQDKDKQIIACIYIAARIRNNLLHGLKDFAMLNNQINIFRNLYLFLKRIIEKNVIDIY